MPPVFHDPRLATIARGVRLRLGQFCSAASRRFRRDVGHYYSAVYNIGLRNHCEAIAAMDFFSVPSITCGILYVFSSSAMIAGAFSTSMSPAIPPATRSCSSCARPFPTKRRRSS